MTKERTPSGHPPSIDQVGQVYRQLADSYSDERARLTKERTWARIELKQAMARRRSSWLPSLTLSSAFGRGRNLSWAFAALALTAVGLLLLWPRAELLEYSLEGGTLRDQWVLTTVDTATLDFTDGSRVQLDLDTALTVNALGRHSALARVGHGSLRVAVEHHDDTNWTFLAGPYEVRVEGTAFDLRWTNEELRVSMHEGRVRVVGPEQREWVLERGDELVLPPGGTEPSAASDGAVRPDGSPVDSAVPLDRVVDSAGSLDPMQPAGAQGASPPDESLKPSAEPSSKLSWSRWLGEGRFQDIVDEARGIGAASAVKNRPLADVVALAHAARYVNDAALAESAWKAIRARAPGSASAQPSAFFLGRIMEQQGRGGDAVTWFERYLQEAPDGVYAGQALGRQVVLASGAKARERAREYLQRYPSGPYANSARSALKGPAPLGDPSVSDRDDALSGE